MGQTSSQIEPSSAQQAIAAQSTTQAETKTRKRKHKKPHGSEQRAAEDHDQEESARALMQMREGAVNAIRLPSVDRVEDSIAASSQLMHESYNSRTPELSDRQAIYKKPKRSEERKKRRHEKKKRKQEVSGSGKETDIVLPQQRKVSPAASVSQKAMDDIDELFEERADVPQSSLNLDDINSDDGDVASLLQDYEAEDMRSSPSHISHTQPDTDRGGHTVSATDNLLPAPPSYDNSKSEGREKRKKKHKMRSLPSSDLYVEEGQEPLDDTGQHSFDIDFEAFDDFCAANGIGAANIFDEIPEQALPFNPKCIEDNPEATHITGCYSSPTKARKSKLRRTSSGSKEKHKRTEIKAPLVSLDPPFDSSGTLNDEQQDQVLPGYEDMQRQSSQEANFSNPSNGSHRQAKYPAEEDLNASTSLARKTGAGKGRGSKDSRELQRSSSISEDEPRQGGPFTGAETSKLEDYRENYCENHGVSLWHFNELVQARQRDKPKAPDMWQGMYEILPYRKRVSIQRFCRRRFHNFEVRGTWTAEDDELLKQAVEEKGKSWVAVGQIMNRFPEDVRDRYRNYLVNAEHRNKEHWSDAEIRNLVRAVLDCIQCMQHERMRAWEASYEGRDLPEVPPKFDQNEEDSKLINWQSVSDRMHGTRSRLQCSFKWSHLKDKDKRRFLKEIRASKRGREIKEVEKETKNPWRAVKAMRKAQLMRPGDKHELLLALSTCTALDEDNIPWKSLGNEEFRARWTGPEKKAAWQMMKEKSSRVDQDDYQEAVNLLLTMQMYEDQNLDEKWDPGLHGYGDARPPMTKQERAENRKRKYQEKLEKMKKRRKIKRENQPANAYRAPEPKSAFFVAESDDEDVDQSSMAVEGCGLGAQSTSDSRRSSNGLAANEGTERDAEAAETADTSVDDFGEDELPKSRQGSVGFTKSSKSPNNARSL